MLIGTLLIGTVAAQIWSNSLTWSLTAEDPAFTLEWSVGPPTTAYIGSQFPLEINVTRAEFAGAYTGVFQWFIEAIPIGADVGDVELNGLPFNATMYIETPFFMDDGVYNLNYNFTMLLTYVGTWDFSVFLTGSV